MGTRKWVLVFYLSQARFSTPVRSRLFVQSQKKVEKALEEAFVPQLYSRGR